ncbi:MAG: hypothetical protein Q8J89_06190 [Caulobacter sp.]|nr:hypothetical protein [Caulobacter sp.]
MTPTGAPPQHTAADFYGFFLDGLRDIVADAEAARVDPTGIALLRQALTVFEAEFRRRHTAAAAVTPPALPMASDAPEATFYWHALAGLTDDAWASDADVEGIALLDEAMMLLRPAPTPPP